MIRGQIFDLTIYGGVKAPKFILSELFLKLNPTNMTYRQTIIFTGAERTGPCVVLVNNNNSNTSL